MSKFGVKGSEYILPSHGHIFKKRAYLRPLLGLTSLHSVNIPPHSKLHLPHTEIFWIRPCRRFRMLRFAFFARALEVLVSCCCIKDLIL